MLAAATRAALRTHPLEIGSAKVIAGIAGALDGDLERGSAFVTLAYVQLNLVTGAYRLADAGHGLHFIIRDCGAAVEHVSSKDMPIGMCGDWHDMCGVLEPGDAALLVSDGVMDLWGGTVESLYEAVERCVRQYCGDAHATIEALCLGAADAADIDDVTAVIMGREPARVPQAAASAQGTPAAVGDPSDVG